METLEMKKYGDGPAARPRGDALKKVIMIDIDGCLADFMLSWRTLANGLYGVEIYKTGDPQYDNWSQGDLTEDQQDYLWRVVKSDPSWWYNVPPLVTGEETERLRDLCGRHTVYFVTARVGETAKIQTEAWLRRHFGILNPTVIISKWKGEAAGALEAHASIDDKAENAWMVAWHTRGKTRSYLLDRPYNQSNGGSRKVVRVFSMLEFMNAGELSP
jgi:5'(3')-deoxyribonucleotidase